MEFKINITVNSTGAVAGADRSTAALAKTEARANSLQRSLVRAFLVFGAIRAVKSAVSTLADFDDAIKTVGAIAGSTELQLAALSQTAQELGINTRFSAVEAAEGLVTLARAGFTVRESQQAIAQVLDLAVAGATSLADAADITATALRSFGIAADESGRVTDVLTKAANSANTTVTQLGQGLKFVGPIARGLNVSFEQTTAALGTLSDAGLKATLAGTGFRRILAELESPTTRNIKRFTELGLTTDQLQVSQVGLTSALQALSDAGVTAGDALRIFGQRGGPAFEVLVRNIGSLKEFTTELENAGGTAKRTAEIIDSSLKGALIRVESAYKGFLIAIGDTGPTNALTQVFNLLSGALRFVAENADLAAAALVPLVGVIGTAGIASLLGFGGALAAAGPFLAVFAGGLVAVNFAMIEMNESAKQIREAFQALDADAGFATLGTGMRLAQQEAKLLEQVIATQAEKGVEATDIQVVRLKELRARYTAAKDEIKRTTAEQKALNEAQKNAPFEEVLAALERERSLLAQVNEEKRVQNELDKVIQGLEDKGFDASGPQKDLLEASIAQTQSLRDQRKVLDDIDGPAREFNRQQAALEALMIRLPARAEEFKNSLRELREEFEASRAQDPFAAVVESIKEANAELELRNRGSNFQADALQIENDLRKQGVELTNEQQEILAQVLLKRVALKKAAEDNVKQEKATRDAILEQLKLREKATKIIERNNEVAAQANVDFLVKLKDLGDLSLSGLLSELRELPDGPVVLSAQLDVIRQQWEDGTLGVLDYGRAVEDLGTKGVKDLTLFERGLANLSIIAEEFGQVLSTQVTDAIVEFVETGKFSFEDFAESLISALLRIIVKLLVIKALEASGLGGSGTAGAVGTAISGRQRGGNVQPDRAFIVGEDGPELFQPNKGGRVVSNQASFGGNAPAPIVNVQNVVVQNENMVPEAIANGSADKALITRLGVLRDQVNKVTGNA